MNAAVYGERRAISGKGSGSRVMRDRELWAIAHTRCMVCWCPRQLETHEIVGGSMRSMEPYNYARLCRRCHDSYHSRGKADDLKLPHILFAKYEYSCIELAAQFPPNAIVEGAWNWHRLGFLYRPTRLPVSAVCLPSMECIPKRFHDERRKYVPGLCSHVPLGSPPCHKLDPEAYRREDESGILLLKKPAGSETASRPSLNRNGVLANLSAVAEWRSIFSASVLMPCESQAPTL